MLLFKQSVWPRKAARIHCAFLFFFLSANTQLALTACNPDKLNPTLAACTCTLYGFLHCSNACHSSQVCYRPVCPLLTFQSITPETGCDLPHTVLSKRWIVKIAFMNLLNSEFMHRRFRCIFRNSKLSFILIIWFIWGQCEHRTENNKKHSQAGWIVARWQLDLCDISEKKMTVLWFKKTNCFCSPGHLYNDISK